MVKLIDYESYLRRIYNHIFVSAIEEGSRVMLSADASLNDGNIKLIKTPELIKFIKQTDNIMLSIDYDNINYLYWVKQLERDDIVLDNISESIIDLSLCSLLDVEHSPIFNQPIIPHYMNVDVDEAINTPDWSTFCSNLVYYLDHSPFAPNVKFNFVEKGDEASNKYYDISNNEPHPGMLNGNPTIFYHNPNIEDTFSTNIDLHNDIVKARKASVSKFKEINFANLGLFIDSWASQNKCSITFQLDDSDYDKPQINMTLYPIVNLTYTLHESNDALLIKKLQKELNTKEVSKAPSAVGIRMAEYPDAFFIKIVGTNDIFTNFYDKNPSDIMPFKAEQGIRGSHSKLLKNFGDGSPVNYNDFPLLSHIFPIADMAVKYPIIGDLIVDEVSVKSIQRKEKIHISWFIYEILVDSTSNNITSLKNYDKPSDKNKRIRDRYIWNGGLTDNIHHFNFEIPHNALIVPSMIMEMPMLRTEKTSSDTFGFPLIIPDFNTNIANVPLKVYPAIMVETDEEKFKGIMRSDTSIYPRGNFKFGQTTNYITGDPNPGLIKVIDQYKYDITHKEKPTFGVVFNNPNSYQTRSYHSSTIQKFQKEMDGILSDLIREQTKVSFSNIANMPENLYKELEELVDKGNFDNSLNYNFAELQAFTNLITTYLIPIAHKELKNNSLKLLDYCKIALDIVNGINATYNTTILSDGLKLTASTATHKTMIGHSLDIKKLSSMAITTVPLFDFLCKVLFPKFDELEDTLLSQKPNSLVEISLTEDSLPFNFKPFFSIEFYIEEDIASFKDSFFVNSFSIFGEDPISLTLGKSRRGGTNTQSIDTKWYKND